MNIRPKVRNAALVGALAAITATAWATSDSMSSTTYVPANSVAAEQPAVTTSDAIVVNDSLSPNETVVTTSETQAIPVVDRSVQPPITVETQRLSEDQRIQMQVMDKLASNEHLSGKIGVESNDAVVRLTGYTSTVGQAYRAGRDAGSIVGVRYVQNEIRPRVGGSVS
jgi:hyperosmotically inducible periplasmic protein